MCGIRSSYLSNKRNICKTQNRTRETQDDITENLIAYQNRHETYQFICVTYKVGFCFGKNSVAVNGLSDGYVC